MNIRIDKRVENLGDETMWFLPVGLDESYFTPIKRLIGVRTVCHY